MLRTLALVSHPRGKHREREWASSESSGARIFEDVLEGRIRGAMDRATGELVETQENITIWKPKEETSFKRQRVANCAHH